MSCFQKGFLLPVTKARNPTIWYYYFSVSFSIDKKFTVWLAMAHYSSTISRVHLLHLLANLNANPVLLLCFKNFLFPPLSGDVLPGSFHRAVRVPHLRPNHTSNHGGAVLRHLSTVTGETKKKMLWKRRGGRKFATLGCPIFCCCLFVFPYSLRNFARKKKLPESLSKRTIISPLNWAKSARIKKSWF